MESAAIYAINCSAEDLRTLRKVRKYDVCAHFSPCFECEHIFFNHPLDAQMITSKTIGACWASIYPNFKEYVEIGGEKFKEKFPEIWKTHYKQVIEEFGTLVEFGRGYPYWISQLLLSVEDKTSHNVHIVNEGAWDNGKDNFDWYVREGFITKSQKNDILQYLEQNGKKIRRMLRDIKKPAQVEK